MIPRRDIYFFINSLVFFVIIVLSSFQEQINSIALYVLIPILSVLCFVRFRSQIISFNPLSILFSLFLWMLLTGVVANDKTLFISQIKKTFGVVLFCTIIFTFSIINKKYLYVLYFLFCIKFLYFFLYSLNNNLLVTEYTNSRFNIDELNANAFGYFGFFAITGSYLILLKARSRTEIFIAWTLVVFCTSFGVYSVLVAASRAGFIVILASSALYSIIYFFFPISKRSILFVFIVIAFMILCFGRISSTLEKSYLLSRFHQVENDSRKDLFKHAIDVGLQNPIFGVGSGNFVTFDQLGSHSSYAELFANNGFIGLLLFLVLVLESVRISFKLVRIKSAYHKHSLIFLVFFILFLFYNFFYWFYLNIFLLGFFFLLRTHMELALNEEVDSINN
jgi:O-antigen ligase